MTYELALKLKEAGFPQRKPRFKGTERIREMFGPDFPTLDELIDACGERFGSLTQWDRQKQGRGWIVTGHRLIWDDDDVEGFIRVEGSSREIAVANLWLELQKNK